ncbi:MAG: histidine phosphatase family protein [Firmicutes bacterium]|nr:histidine phosphatase family protein [Bacillota bacterium]
MRIILIRHGKTEGNKERRYIGSTDEGLCDEGIEELKGKKYPDVQFVITSGMKRCEETADIIYKGKERKIYEGLRECDFGKFEYMCYEELKEDKDYIRWIESGGECGFPDGEDKAGFCKRCCAEFERSIAENSDKESIAYVVHGGTIMAIGEKYLGKGFYDMQVKNGEWVELWKN